MKLRRLVGSGDRIGLLVLPVLVVGLVLNVRYPSAFGVGGPTRALRVASIFVLVPGLAIWLWSAILILTRVPRGQLITAGPFAVVKHPLYTGVALLVLPWVGFLLNSWLGVLLGTVLYLAARIFERREEADLANAFGARWEAYRRRVAIPWL
jgi:protein-S-isoprenylcysteine O-methyltransferase Ste14